MANLAQDHQKAGQAHRKGSARRLLLTGILIALLILGSLFVLPSLLPKPDLFPPLCSGNFQSANTPANTSIVPTPTTSTSPDGELIGLSEGANIFDLQRPNQQEVQYKLQAAQDWMNNPQNVAQLLKNAISSDPTDAEAQIYLENWQVLASNHPHITFVVGVNFASIAAPASRGALQGAFTAQKECNKQNQQDDSKTQTILMIANIGGNNPDDRASSAKFVANQIADQANKDPTIVGIMGWLRSGDSINVNHQLKVRNSTLPMVSPISASDELAEMAHFFRVCPKNAEQAQIAADFILNKKHKTRLAVIYDLASPALNNNLEREFVKHVSASNIVGQASYAEGDQGALQTALNKVLAQKPDAIFFASYVTDLPELLKDIPQPNNLLIVGGDTLANTTAYPNPLPDLHNVYFTAFANPNEWDGIDHKPPFFQKYNDNFGTVTALNGLPSIDPDALLGYDAMLTLLHASQQALSKHNNTITPPYLEDELKQITGPNAIQGITGRIAFDSSGNQDEHKMIFVEHIEGNKLVIDEKYGCLQKDNCSS